MPRSDWGSAYLIVPCSSLTGEPMTAPAKSKYHGWTLKDISNHYQPTGAITVPISFPITRLHSARWTFQKRADSDLTIGRLMTVLEQKGEFSDPILFIRLTNGDAIVVDGHHRVMAARNLHHETLLSKEHTGTLADAILAATRANGEVKAPISNSQSMDYAWLWFVAARPHPRHPSKDELARTLGVSPRSITNLRKVYNTILDLEVRTAGSDDAIDLLDITTWRTACDTANAPGETGYKTAMVNEETIRRMKEIRAKRAAAIAKSFGSSLTRPEFAAELMADVLANSGLDVREFLGALTKRVLGADGTMATITFESLDF